MDRHLGDILSSQVRAVSVGPGVCLKYGDHTVSCMVFGHCAMHLNLIQNGVECHL